jgi:hypothetical protein
VNYYEVKRCAEMAVQFMERSKGYFEPLHQAHQKKPNLYTAFGVKESRSRIQAAVPPPANENKRGLHD